MSSKREGPKLDRTVSDISLDFGGHDPANAGNNEARGRSVCGTVTRCFACCSAFVLGIAPVALGLAGFILSILTLQSCDFVTLVGQHVDGKLGLFRWGGDLCLISPGNTTHDTEVEGCFYDCARYESIAKEALIDGPQEAARILGALATALGGLAVACFFSMAAFFGCCEPGDAEDSYDAGIWSGPGAIVGAILIIYGWCFIGILLLLAGVAQMLTFLFFNHHLCSEDMTNDFECRLGSGATTSIAAGVSFLVSASLIFVAWCLFFCSLREGRPERVEATRPERAEVTREAELGDFGVSTLFHDGKQ